MLARNSLLARLAGFGRLLGLQQRRLRSLALGDVQEGDHRSHDLALLADGIGPVFHREARAVGAPENFLV